IIEFNTSSLSADDLAQLESYGKTAREDGEIVTVETENLVHTMEQMLAWSRERKIPLTNMTVRQPNLEDVFLLLTGRRLRE
ncbi:hypothetical protein KAX17_15085, partial [Candidatus Bipolaricaulota bacterium]|nr:hypothetical protein [Candidatus Bipolaricaulota bacterium]